jgi:hypothetical protein
MKNERARPVDIVFSSGVRQDLNPQTAPPGTLVSCDNLEFDQLGRLITRGAFSLLGTTIISKTHSIFTQVRRFAQSGDGTRLLFSDDNAYQYIPADDKMCEAGLDGQSCTLRASLTDVTGIVSDQGGQIKWSDCLSFGAFVIYLYVQGNTGSTNDVCVDIIDTASGTRLMTRKVIGSTSAIQQPRLVLAGGSNVVTAVWDKAGTTSVLQFAKLDFGFQPYTWGAPTDTITTSGPCIFDVDSLTSGWCLAYYDQPVNAVIVDTINQFGTITGSYTWKANAGAANWQPTVLSISGNPKYGTNIHVVGYDPATQFLESQVLSSTLTSVAKGRTNPGFGGSKHGRQLAIIHTASGQSLLALSNYTSATVSTNPRGHLYFYTLVDAGTLAAQQTFANYTLGSRFYADSSARGGSVFVVARFNDPSGFQSHYLLLDLGGIDIGLIGPQPVCHFASGRVTLFSDNATTGLGGIADLSSITPGQFQFSGYVNIGASTRNGNQVQAWTFESRGSKRFLSTPCQGQVVLGGGTPLIYDGQRLVEASFFSWPVVNSGNFTTASTGGVLVDGVYQYRVVWEWTDAAGNRHQSPASPAVSITLSGGTNTQLVTISIPSINATRKQGGPGVSDNWSPVKAIIYRTLAGGSVFYRCLNGANNHTAATTDATYTDSNLDSQIAVDEVLYVAAGGQGLLATTAPPPTLMMTTHQQRLWGVDMENPERIWCTKVLQPGTAPSYNQALQVLIPGAGRINGLGAQDGKLYALATNGIYLASYGDGPDDTGGGTFPSPQLITTTANCQDPRGVLTGQDGIFFTGIDQWGTGIYLIRRGDGQPISIGKRVRKELATYPVCRGIVNRTQKARTEFLFVDSDTNPTNGAILYYHHDYPDAEGIGQWTVARVLAGEALECLGVWDDKSTVADMDTNLGWQDDSLFRDFGIAYPTIKIETTDIRPFGLVGYGQINGIMLLGTASTADNIKLEASYDSGMNWTDSNLFPQTIETTGEPILRHWEQAQSKLPRGGEIRLRITNTTVGLTNPGITYYHGVTLDATQLGGGPLLADTERA